MAAWREVARRIAHEVKNPLTPIQLSAQRLRKRYLENLTEDGEVFDQCTKTIINQVDELKRLVTEFSSFARMPAVQKDMNNLAPQQPFDIIISDPPYGKDMPNTLLTNKSLGKTGSFWLIEAETGYIPKFSKSDFELLKEKRFGKSTLFLFLQS